jgi:acyl-coenzyme A synthetase/AMP-(fatty) acid ligase
MPRAVAVVEGGASVTHEDLAADLVRTVWCLERLGVRPDMVVGAEHPRAYCHLLLILACSVIGARTMSLTAGELLASPSLLAQCDMLLAGSNLASEYRAKAQTIAVDFPRGLAMAPVAVDCLQRLYRAIPPDEVVRITKSSGTTGSPKTMAITHAVMQRIIRHTIGHVLPDLTVRPSFLCLYSLGVRAAYSRVFGTLMHGGTVHFAADMNEVSELIAAGSVNYALFVVGDMQRVLQLLPTPPLGHVLEIELIGGPVSLKLRKDVRERLNARVTVKYSSNETNRVSIIGDDDVGILCPGVAVRIVDDRGDEVPFGVTGLVRIKTQTMAAGYNNDPVANARCFVDGWYHSSDIGYMPEAGKLVILGRADDVLNIGGLKIAPFEIEDQIKRIEGLSDSAVLHVSDAYGHDVLLVALEIAGGDSPPNLPQRLAPILSQYMRPCEFLVLRQFPRTETGKTKRQELKAIFRQQQARAFA